MYRLASGVTCSICGLQIIRLTPRNSSSADAVTIIGAHCDSINDENPFFRSPGADDDGSGTITVLEAFRGM